MDYTHFCFTPI